MHNIICDQHDPKLFQNQAPESSFCCDNNNKVSILQGLHGQGPDPLTRSLEPSFGILYSILAKHPTSARLPNNRTSISLVKIGYRFLGHLPSLLWDQPKFQAPPSSPQGGRPTVENDAMSP
ncbi:hypothetical protein M9H77_02468 [Catharanthus roseus]|uniref:Uncharacterized protein n=1 Tax=Catharanthus roseus TaxID=4058 RepID=A0ACC0C8I2_CATRO|nr:hypothetical protein M9H77_02468 [Catharanthus roseus]